SAGSRYTPARVPQRPRTTRRRTAAAVAAAAPAGAARTDPGRRLAGRSRRQGQVELQHRSHEDPPVLRVGAELADSCPVLASAVALVLSPVVLRRILVKPPHH